MLTREAILSSRPTPPVAVQALGDTVHVRILSAGERDAFEIDHARQKGANFRARLLVACACDEAGKDLFRLGDIAAVADLPTSAIEPIVQAAMKVNGFAAGEEEGAAVPAPGGTTEGNSATPTTPSTDSPGVSPPTSG